MHQYTLVGLNAAAGGPRVRVSAPRSSATFQTGTCGCRIEARRVPRKKSALSHWARSQLVAQTGAGAAARKRPRLVEAEAPAQPAPFPEKPGKGEKLRPKKTDLARKHLPDSRPRCD
ncbi:UNVERIFIED_CONTAM: hypothetical protein K2H54_039698 [Gekko kuhli]